MCGQSPERAREVERERERKRERKYMNVDETACTLERRACVGCMCVCVRIVSGNHLKLGVAEFLCDMRCTSVRMCISVWVCVCVVGGKCVCLSMSLSLLLSL